MNSIVQATSLARPTQHSRQQRQPGIIDTEMFHRFGNPTDPADVVVQTFTHRTPIKRLGNAQEVAEAVI